MKAITAFVRRIPGHIWIAVAIATASAAHQWLVGKVLDWVTAYIPALSGFVSSMRDTFAFIRPDHLFVFACAWLVFYAWTARASWIGVLRTLSQWTRDKPRESVRAWLGIEDAVRAATPQAGNAFYSPTVRQEPPASVALDDDDIMFRRELQSFVTRLMFATAKLDDLLEQLFRWSKTSGNNNSFCRLLEIYMREAVDARNPKKAALAEMSQTNIKLMDPRRLEDAIESFLRNEYPRLQIAVFDFNKFAEVNFETSKELEAFLTVDRDCLKRLQDLKARPKATTLKTVPDELMASERHKDWGIPS